MRKTLFSLLRHIGSRLQGHPNMNDTPGVDMSTGSLGQGISAAVGMALAAKHWGDSYRVYTLLGDGECEEGQVWEAAMFAGNHDLDNLVAIVDHNGLQIDGSIDEVNSLSISEIVCSLILKADSIYRLNVSYFRKTNLDIYFGTNDLYEKASG